MTTPRPAERINRRTWVQGLGASDEEIERAANNGQMFDNEASRPISFTEQQHEDYGPSNNEGGDFANPGPDDSTDQYNEASLQEIHDNLSEGFEPIPPPEGYPPLTFKPFQLQTWFLLTSLVYFVACMAGVIGVMFLYEKFPYRLHIHENTYHTTVRYLPGAIGSITSVWYRSISSTYGRIAPYTTMAAASNARNGGSKQRSDYDILQRDGTLNVFNPNIGDIRRMAKNKQLLTLALVIISTLIQPFFVPLKASFVHLVPDSSGWQVHISMFSGYCLIASYLLFISCTVLVLVRLWSQTTGLKWDVVSIADQLALVQGSNILKAFQGLEFANHKEMALVMRYRARQNGSLRLGYWCAKNDNQLIWHGIRFMPLPKDNHQPTKLSFDWQQYEQIYEVGIPLHSTPKERRLLASQERKRKEREKHERLRAKRLDRAGKRGKNKYYSVEQQMDNKAHAPAISHESLHYNRETNSHQPSSSDPQILPDSTQEPLSNNLEDYQSEPLLPGEAQGCDENCLSNIIGYELASSPQITAENAGTNNRGLIRGRDHWGHQQQVPNWCNACPYMEDEAPLNWYNRVVCSPEFLRFRSIFPELSDIFLALLIVISVCGLTISVLLITVGILHRGLIFENLFVDVGNVTATRFILDFFPSLLLSLFSITWIQADRFYRTTQPISGMIEPGPATETILLDYIGTFPPLAIIKAASNKHWRVAWFAFLAITCSAAPIPAGSIFVFTPEKADVKIALVPASLYASMAILVIYVLSIILVRPPPRYRLPRYIRNLADLLCYCYDSKLVDSPVFSVQKPTDEHVHLESQVHLEKGQYQFGMYLGKDGRRHIGFDQVGQRHNNSGRAEEIDSFDTGRTAILWDSWCFWFRRPRLIRAKVE